MLSKKTSEKTGVKGWHRLSLCDVRDPSAAKLQNDIVAFCESEEASIRGLLAKILGLRSRFVVDPSQDTLRDEITRLRANLRQIRDHKHTTLRQMYARLREISLVFDVEVPNIIPTAGRAVIARWLTGDNTYSGDDGANYGSLGTSSTAPSNSDTQLAAETYRKATSSVAQASNVATLSNFYTATEVTGTFEEAGWHIAGTASANTGQLLSRFLTGTVVKSSTETLTVESEITIS